MTDADFQKDNYEKTQLISNELTSSSDPLYDFPPAKNWRIVIQVDRTTKAKRTNSTSKSRFQNQYELGTGFHHRQRRRGKCPGSAGIKQFHDHLCNRPFSTWKFYLTRAVYEGSPSAITTQEFFLIPKDYITKGGSNGATGVLRETAGENGSLTTEFVATQIYQENDENYYLDDSSLRVGDHLIKPESTESYTVSQTASLTGVFNINKGYADFKEIQILKQNDEYALIKSNTTYGLSAYDYIVLDASSVDVDQLINE